MKNTCLILALVSTLSASCLAADRWEQIDSSAEQTTFLDRASVLTKNGKTVAWTKTIQAKPTPMGDGPSAPQFLTIKALVEVDCAARKMRRRSATFFAVDESIVVTLPPQDAFSPVAPASRGDSLLTLLCSPTT